MGTPPHPLRSPSSPPASTAASTAVAAATVAAATGLAMPGMWYRGSSRSRRGSSRKHSKGGSSHSSRRPSPSPLLCPLCPLCPPRSCFPHSHSSISLPSHRPCLFHPRLPTPLNPLPPSQATAQHSSLPCLRKRPSLSILTPPSSVPALLFPSTSPPPAPTNPASPNNRSTSPRSSTNNLFIMSRQAIAGAAAATAASYNTSRPLPHPRHPPFLPLSTLPR
mmetsp:Transcript_8121/g.20050  ORF Transcript_8121/g.20050 Transcript_8121/m.20050 type:complete len:221 (+) Transcript_8121:3183-3845(+)